MGWSGVCDEGMLIDGNSESAFLLGHPVVLANNYEQSPLSSIDGWSSTEPDV